MWILVVEDEPAMRDALRQGLEEENHTVTVAADGVEGMHAAETLNLDAILLDVMMPGMSGIDLVRRLLIEIEPALKKKAGAGFAAAMLYFGMINWTHTWFDAKGAISAAALADMVVDLTLGGLAKTID